MLPLSGRLTDRAGGGPVVLAGCLLLTAATVPLMFVTGDTPYPVLAGVPCPRARTRRRGPTLRRCGLPAARLSTGASGHRRAQHAATNRWRGRRHPARGRPPTRGGGRTASSSRASASRSLRRPYNTSAGGPSVTMKHGRPRSSPTDRPDYEVFPSRTTRCVIRANPRRTYARIPNTKQPKKDM